MISLYLQRTCPLVVKQNATLFPKFWASLFLLWDGMFLHMDIEFDHRCFLFYFVKNTKILKDTWKVKYQV